MKRKAKLSFDPAKEAESLYFTLLKRGEYVSAASILNRLIGSGVDDALSPQASLEAWADAELQTLGVFLKQIYLLKKQVAERLNQPFALEQAFEESESERVQVPRSEPPAPPAEPERPDWLTDDESIRDGVIFYRDSETGREEEFMTVAEALAQGLDQPGDDDDE